MTISKIFEIDIRAHYRLHNLDLMNDGNDELRIQNNYELFLHRAEIELLDKAVIEGLFDNAKQTNISFRKIPYDKNEKEKALFYLQNEYMIDHHYCLKEAIKMAQLQYEKIKPFNLIMLVEMIKES